MSDLSWGEVIQDVGRRFGGWKKIFEHAAESDPNALSAPLVARDLICITCRRMIRHGQRW